MYSAEAGGSLGYMGDSLLERKKKGIVDDQETQAD